MRATRSIFVAALGVYAAVSFTFIGRAQDSAPAHSDSISFQDHIKNAKLLAADDLAGRNLTDCAMPPVSAAPTTKPVTAAPTKVFDQLYYLGTNIVASWALVTSDGIIQIDSLNNNDDAAARSFVAGYKKLGLDPAQIKYIVLTHGHDDHFGGAKYLQDTYHPHVLMSATDWDMVAWAAERRAGFPAPQRDMDIMDGQKFTLGETTLTFYLTPGQHPAPSRCSFLSRTTARRTCCPSGAEARRPKARAARAAGSHRTPGF